MDDAPALEPWLQELRDRHGCSWAAPHPGQSQRPPGGLPLREGSPVAESMARDAVLAGRRV